MSAVSFKTRLGPRRTVGLAALVALAAGLSACGQISHPTSASSEGVYVDAGPITYQVQLSRELNPYATEDRQYLIGTKVPGPAKDQLWFAVFLWAKNQSSQPANTSRTFDIVDTQGDRYYPVAVNPQMNPFAWTPQTLAQGQTEPGVDTPGSFSATQGLEVLFKLSNTVYNNRPLTLEIYPPGSSKPSSVSLDL